MNLLNLITQQLINGIVDGSIYAALGVALVLVIRSTGVINFAQGEMSTLGAYVAWLVVFGLNFSYWIGLPVALLFGFMLGALFERFVIRRVEGEEELSIVIVTVGFFFVINNIVRGIWTDVPKLVPSPFGDGAIATHGVFVTFAQLGTLAVVLVLMAATFTFFRVTKTGLAMRGLVSNTQAARLVGVNVERMLMLGWGLASVIGTVAAMLTANLIVLEPSEMSSVLIFAFAAIVLGGLNSSVGAVVGGLLVGVVQSLASSVPFIGPSLNTAVAMALIVLVLIARPHGLFGRATVSRA